MWVLKEEFGVGFVEIILNPFRIHDKSVPDFAQHSIQNSSKIRRPDFVVMPEASYEKSKIRTNFVLKFHTKSVTKSV